MASWKTPIVARSLSLFQQCESFFTPTDHGTSLIGSQRGRVVFLRNEWIADLKSRINDIVFAAGKVIDIHRRCRTLSCVLGSYQTLILTAAAIASGSPNGVSLNALPGPHVSS